MHAEMHAIYNAAGRLAPPPAAMSHEHTLCSAQEGPAARYVLPGSSRDGSVLLDSGPEGVGGQRVLSTHDQEQRAQ